MITTEKIPSAVCVSKTYDEPTFLYCHTGKVDLSISGACHNFLASGYLTLLPAGLSLELSGVRDSLVVVIRLSYIESLSCSEQYVYTCLSNTSRRENVQFASHFPGVLRCDYSPLRNFMNSLVVYVDSGLNMSALYESKVKELFCLIRMSYSEKELEKLFVSPCGSSKDASFIRFVEDNYNKYDSAFELACAMNYSYSGFSKRFRQVFGIPAYQWIKERKAKQVYAAILNADIPLKEVSYQLGFPSLPNFYKFCSSNFGRPPGEIRKEFRIG